MSDDTVDLPPTPERVTWRNVFAAVLDSEARIKEAIREAVAPVANEVADHEARLRKIETGDLPWVNRLAGEAEKTHSDQGRRLGDLETAVGLFKGREVGVGLTLGLGRQLVLIIAAIFGAVATFYSILDRIAPG